MTTVEGQQRNTSYASGFHGVADGRAECRIAVEELFTASDAQRAGTVNISN
jgi:hypothetical protein